MTGITSEERSQRNAAIYKLHKEQSIRKAHLARMFHISRQMVDTIIKQIDNSKIYG